MTAATVERLCEALRSKKSFDRWSAAVDLGNLGDPAAEKPLFEALQDESLWVRLAAVNALVALDERRPPRPIVDALRKAAGEQVDEVEAWVPPDAHEIYWKGLFRLKSLNPVEKFIGALDSDDRRMRGLAALMLGSGGDLRAVEPLIRALKDPHGPVRAGAARSLGELKAPQALKALVWVLGDDSPLVRRSAAAALVSIPGGTDELRAARKSGNARCRREAARALRRARMSHYLRKAVGLLRAVRRRGRKEDPRRLG